MACNKRTIFFFFSRVNAYFFFLLFQLIFSYIPILCWFSQILFLIFHKIQTVSSQIKHFSFFNSLSFKKFLVCKKWKIPFSFGNYLHPHPIKHTLLNFPSKTTWEWEENTFATFVLSKTQHTRPGLKKILLEKFINHVTLTNILNVTLTNKVFNKKNDT